MYTEARWRRYTKGVILSLIGSPFVVLGFLYKVFHMGFNTGVEFVDKITE